LEKLLVVSSTGASFLKTETSFVTLDPLLACFVVVVVVVVVVLGIQRRAFVENLLR